MDKELQCFAIGYKIDSELKNGYILFAHIFREKQTFNLGRSLVDK